MKTYLDSTEFADLFFRLYGQRMTNTINASVSDTIIWRMFQEYEKDVKETLKGSMYGIDDYQGDNAIDLIGYRFHKSFRQVDVIDARHIDGIIWACIQDAPVFWNQLTKACKILQSGDAEFICKRANTQEEQT